MTAALLLFQGGAFSQEVPVPRLTQYVTDLTNTLTPQELSTLESKLSAFDKATSTQIVVLMVPTIGNGAIGDFTLRVAEKNAIGRKGKDNGALLFIAKDDRRVRIEVGYGLEGSLPDALAGLIIRRELAPKFRSGDYFGGINGAVDAIILATKNEYKADEKSEPSTSHAYPLILVFVVLFIILRSIRSGPGGRFPGGFGPTIFMGGGWGGGGRIGGGGFGGGGGFSGGGGSFGGGGASGGW